MTAGEFAPVPDSRPDDVPWPAMRWPDSLTVLAGPDVVLRRATLGDAVELTSALAAPVVWDHLTSPRATPEQWAETIAAAADRGRYLWTVRTIAGRVVGTSSYLDVSPHDARLEIGWTAYSPDVWGTAVNPATKLLLLGHAFDDLRVGRVQLKTDVRNVRSQRALARLGARYEGTLRRHQRRWDGTVRDTVLFAITAEDWPQVRAGLHVRLARPHGSAG